MMRRSHMRNHFRKVGREERFPEAGLDATVARALVTASANSENALIGCRSGIHNRGRLSNRTRRTYSNRTGNGRDRNIRTDSPRPTTPESRSRRRR
jgi:hypothetical protein